jgi:SAM-dependent methyltransferase
MKILNPAVTVDLNAGRYLKLNLGSGRRHLPGFCNVDLVDLPGVDLLADLNEPFDVLPDDCVDAIYCRHTLEHVDNFLGLLGEIHRVVRPGGTIDIVVPHFSNPYYYSDPTHVRFFGLYSFFYFCDEADQPRRKVPSFYSKLRFRVDSARFNLMKESSLDKVVRAILHPVINRGIAWLDWYERRLCRIFPVNDIHYVLRPVKAAAPNRWRGRLTEESKAGLRRLAAACGLEEPADRPMPSPL